MFTLKRSSYAKDGVFGVLMKDDQMVCVTLEHAYPNDSGFTPKVPAGTFKCVRGLHRLEGMASQFETFEITGIPGHKNILFHVGNWHTDSSGCVLVGKEEVSQMGTRMITASRDTFAKFMAMLDGVDEFDLTVVA